MSLDNIKLSTTTISDLYKNTLVNTSNIENYLKNDENTVSSNNNSIQEKNLIQNATISPVEKIKYLGNNGRHILIAVADADNAFLDDESLSFLINVLSACSVSMADVAVINTHPYSGVQQAAIMELFAPTILIFAGTTPAQYGFPLQIPHYQVQAYHQQQFLVTPTFKAIAADVAQKKLLWAALKKIFSIA